MLFRIREDQISALSVSARTQFAREIAEYIRREYPQTVQSRAPEILHAEILSAIDCAETYGITRKLDVRTFAAMYFFSGPRFHLHPPIHAVLSNPSIAAADKLDVLFETVPTRDWPVARAAPVR